MVAAAPKEGALRPAVAASLFACVLAVLALTCWLSKYVSLHRLTPLEKPPEVLRARAQEIARRLGYADAPADSEYGMYASLGYLRHMAEHERSPAWWEKLRAGDPSAYYFWYRQSPRPLVTGDDQFVGFQRPPQNVPGMLGVALDTEGRLRYFAVVPERSGAAREEARAFDWATLFAEAGFEQADFRPVESGRPPPHGADALAAWEGTAAGPGGHAVRVEAAALGGRPVHFEVVYPWATPFRQGQAGQLWQNPSTTAVIIAGFLLVLVGSALLAFRNLRLGRGDRRGAFRLALFYFTLLMAAWAFDAHHVAAPLGEFNALVEALQSAGFVAAFIWLVYVALEPFVRRRWPWRIISWSRLLAGDFRDPLVGRDILIGALAGAVCILSFGLALLTPGWLGRPAPAPDFPDSPMLGFRFFASKLATQFMAASSLALVFLFILLLFFIVVRRERLAAAALSVIYAVAVASQMGGFSTLPFAAVYALVTVGVLYRYGLLAQVSSMFIFHLWTFFPVTTELGAWYAADFALAAAVTLAIVLYGFYTSLAGQPLLRGDLLED
jgi:serine/threonine-protein kinase